MQRQQTGVRLPTMVYLQAREAAIHQGKTLNEMLCEAVIEYLQRHPQDLSVSPDELEKAYESACGPYDNGFNPFGHQAAKIRNKGWARPNRHSLPAPLPENIKHPYGGDE